MSLPLPSQEEDVGQGCAGDLREGGLGCRGLFLGFRELWLGAAFPADAPADLGVLG